MNHLSDKQARQLSYLRQKAERPGYIYEADCLDCDVHIVASDTNRDAIVDFMREHPSHEVKLTPIAASEQQQPRFDPQPPIIDSDYAGYTDQQAIEKLVIVGLRVKELASQDYSLWNPALAQCRHAWSCINDYRDTITQEEIDGIMTNAAKVLAERGIVL